MSRLPRIVIVAVVALATLTLAADLVTAGQTDRQRYEAAIKKAALPLYAFSETKKLSKAICACNATERVGVLETFDGGDTVGITCTVYSFNTDGSLFAVATCNDWTLIAK